ncbi:MAG: prenyltransferase/squalene oxidase repeat-containing protein [Thermoguttaceae bacterium]
MIKTFNITSAILISLLYVNIDICKAASYSESELKTTINQGLDWLAAKQTSRGSWEAAEGTYPCAMTGMAGIALLCEGSTPTQGKYAENIRKATDYLISRSRPNGLIGDPKADDRYTYGHGFGMLFLSQVLGEEDYIERRQEIIDVLTRAVEFSGKAQTREGGWGYVSAQDGSNFDEGSTTITQVQALRGCRNAGIPVPKEIIDRAIKYIHKCSLQGGAGGVQYNIGGGGGRPPISAAAIACLFNAGEYDDSYVPKLMAYCDKTLLNVDRDNTGFWHYAHYYFAQVKYRQGGNDWEKYRDKIFRKLIDEAASDGSWSQDYVGPVYTSAINLTILQLEKAALPIYQK